MPSQGYVRLHICRLEMLLLVELSQIPHLDRAVFGSTDQRAGLWHELQASDHVHVGLKRADWLELQVRPSLPHTLHPSNLVLIVMVEVGLEGGIGRVLPANEVQSILWEHLV